MDYIAEGGFGLPEFNSLTKVDIAFVTESAATNKSFLKDLPPDVDIWFAFEPKKKNI